MSPRIEHLAEGKVILHPGDCLDVMRELVPNSADSCVTDPPYHLTSINQRFGKDGSAPVSVQEFFDVNGKSKGNSAYKTVSTGFMGKQWDGGDIAFRPDVWREVFRVLKPGAHLLSFGGTRTYHRMACAIEDAGFEIRDTIMWLYGQGFNKDGYTSYKLESKLCERHDKRLFYRDTGEPMRRAPPFRHPDADEIWGLAGALKPACEPIVLARKPLSESTVAANVLKWGTGALNIDGCRVATDESLNGGAYAQNGSRVAMAGDEREGAALGMFQPGKTADNSYKQPPGRWPANVIHDGSEEVLAGFPDAPGQQQNIDPYAPSPKTGNVYGKMNREGEASADRRYTENGGTNFAALPGHRRTDSGSAARFFYTAKADQNDRLGSKHPCLPPGELVLTDRGYAAIESIEFGSLVYADDGTFRAVTDRFESPCDAPIYTISVLGTNLKTRATGNHPFLVWRPKITYGRARDTAAVGTAFWLPAEQIRRGDYLLTPVSCVQSDGNAMSVDWWFAAGLWMAEGTVLTNGHGSSRFPQYTLSAKETNLVDRLRRVFKNVGVYPRGKAISVVGFQSGIVDHFIELCGRGAKGKYISPIVLAASDEQRRAFFEGYIAGDGCVVKGRYRAKTASRAAASTLPLLAESLGLRCSFYEHDSSGRVVHIDGRQIKQGIYYSLFFDFERFGKRYARPKGKKHSTRFVEHEGRTYSIRGVKEIEASHYRGPVWNLTVEGRHTFQTAVGMSHNTVKPLDLMQYLVRLVTPHGGTVLDCFAGTGTTGEAAFREGMHAILIEREAEYQNDIRRRMALLMAGPEERSRESIKAKTKDKPVDHGPLFGPAPAKQEVLGI